MKELMIYRGYSGVVEYDAEARLFHGEVVNTEAVITFYGRTVDELEQAFRESVDFYLEQCEKRGREPQKPFSGRILLRTSPEIHRAAALAARLEGKSLNAWASEQLREAAKRKAEGGALS